MNDLNEIRRILQRIQWIEMLLDRIWYFLTQCAVLFSLREKKSGQIDFWFYEQHEKSSGKRKTRVIPLTFYEKNTLNVKK